MKSSENRNVDNKSCCVIVKQRPCYKHDEGCFEPFLAMGFITQPQLFNKRARSQLLDALEQLGFTDSLALKV